MRKFAKTIFVFLLPVILLAYPLDILLSRKYMQSVGSGVGEFEVWNDIYEGKIDCKIAIYGSSRAWVHINPEVLKDSLGVSAYNFGIDGHNFHLQYLRHIEYCKNNVDPKIIILSIDNQTLGKRKDLYNMNQFLPYMLWNWNVKKFTSSYEGFSSLDYLVPLVRYRHISLSFASFKERALKMRNNGFKGIEKEWNSDLSDARKESKQYVSILDEESIQLFKKILEECNYNDIEVVLVYTPEYVEGQDYVSNRKDIVKLYDEIAQSYGLTFLDYSNNRVCKKRQYFYNSMHLNAEGADIFSRTLAHDLKNL